MDYNIINSVKMSSSTLLWAGQYAKPVSNYDNNDFLTQFFFFQQSSAQQLRSSNDVTANRQVVIIMKRDGLHSKVSHHYNSNNNNNRLVWNIIIQQYFLYASRIGIEKKYPVLMTSTGVYANINIKYFIQLRVCGYYVISYDIIPTLIICISICQDTQNYYPPIVQKRTPHHSRFGLANYPNSLLLRIYNPLLMLLLVKVINLFVDVCLWKVQLLRTYLFIRTA